VENKIRVFVGLGNPGPEFLWTRHNAGFDVIDVLAQTMNAEFVEDPDLTCLIARPNSSIALVKPQTGMNDSGLTVKALLEKLDTSMDSVMIVYDDIAMPLGTSSFCREGIGRWSPWHRIDASRAFGKQQFSEAESGGWSGRQKWRPARGVLALADRGRPS
jgi:hypothetical protein